MAVRARFGRYILPVLDALRALGGSARPGEVYDWIARTLHVSDAERDVQNKSGVSRFENDVAWARHYLVKDSLVDSSKWGVWSLTEAGRNAVHLSDDQVNDLMRRVQAMGGSTRTTNAPSALVTDDQAEEAEELVAPAEGKAAIAGTTNYREATLELLRSLSPSGFERLCQRILREAGFQQVKVTGRSGDGGIDGVGVLQVNPFVSFKVLFQAKRYQGSVGPGQVRDFRGAMMGRADKGMIITTGTFSADAQDEAVRDGVPPIELVDGTGLVRLLEQYELGLRPLQTFEIDTAFFDEFKQP
jgi:restriction system protein